MSTKSSSFQWAVQIQPLTGQEIAEFPNGVAFPKGHRSWCMPDEKAFPQASKQAGQDFRLIVCRLTGEVYKVEN